MADSTQSNTTQNSTINGLPPSQQLMMEVAQKAYQKQLEQHAMMTPPSILGKLLDHWNGQADSSQQTMPNQTFGGGQPMGASGSTGSWAPQQEQMPQAGSPSDPSQQSMTPQGNQQQQMGTQDAGQMSMAPGQQQTNPNSFNVGQISPEQKQMLQTLTQQAGTISQRNPGILGKIFRGTFEADTGRMLENNKSAQEAVMGVPEQQEKLAQAANINAQTEMQNLTNAGKKPIDPEQYLNAYAGMYQKAYDAYSKDEESGNQTTQSALDAYNKLADTTRKPWEKGLGTVTPQMKAALQQASASLKASIDARTDFHEFMTSSNPAQVIGNVKNKLNQSTSTNVASGAQNVSQMLQPGQSKNVNGNMIKRLK